MTKKEYADYEERVKHYLEGVEHVSTGPCPGCKECDVPEDADEYHEEAWFSSHPCEICKGLAGDRVSWHGIIDGKIVHGSCCTDCMYYLEYGRLDDTTMDEMEAASPREDDDESQAD